MMRECALVLFIDACLGEELARVCWQCLRFAALVTSWKAGIRLKLVQSGVSACHSKGEHRRPAEKQANAKSFCIKSGAKTDGYQLHVGSTDHYYNAFCFEEDTTHLIAIVNNLAKYLQVFVNCCGMTTVGQKIPAI